MFPYLSQNIQHELAQLSQMYNRPLVRTVNLGQTSQFDPLNKTDRYGEVCMVVRRPSGLLLTMLKTFYPREAYRLPTGGINHGEPIADALMRETLEETGLDVEVQQFLAAVAYTTATTGERPIFYTFAFLLDEIGGKLGPLDLSERVESYRFIQPDELPVFVERLSHLEQRYDPQVAGNWHDWGQFRAVIHQAVWEALQASM